MKDKTLILLIIVALFIVLCFLFVPNDKIGEAGLTAIALLLATGSLIISNRSLKQVEKQ